MKKALLLTLLIACTHPHVITTPQQRTKAVELYMNGASSREVASRLGLTHDDAKYLLRTTIAELMQRFNKNH